MSTAPSSNKYYIKSLEEEIGFFDRKLAHLLKFESFPSDEERQVAAGKLSAKRDRLVRTIRELTEGVAVPEASSLPASKKAKTPAKPKTSPRSKAAPESAASVRARAAAEPRAPVDNPATEPTQIEAESGPLPRQASPDAGTSLDSEQELNTDAKHQTA